MEKLILKFKWSKFVYMNRFINDFKTFFLNTFAYHPKTNYNFTLSEFPNTNNSPEDDLKNLFLMC